MDKKSLEKLLAEITLLYHTNGGDNLEALDHVRNVLANTYNKASEYKDPKNKATGTFNTGAYNDIVYAYLILACKRAGIKDEDGQTLLDTMGHLFDEIPAEEALRIAFRR